MAKGKVEGCSQWQAVRVQCQDGVLPSHKSVCRCPTHADATLSPGAGERQDAQDAAGQIQGASKLREEGGGDEGKEGVAICIHLFIVSGVTAPSMMLAPLLAAFSAPTMVIDGHDFYGRLVMPDHPNTTWCQFLNECAGAIDRKYGEVNVLFVNRCSVPAASGGPSRHCHTAPFLWQPTWMHTSILPRCPRITPW